MDPQVVTAEALPMLNDVLGRIGLHRTGALLDFPALLHPFSHWVQEQAVSDADFAFMAALVGAFICEYSIACFGARRIIEAHKIRLGIPIQAGILRDFDPYAVAVGIVRERGNLADFLRNVGA